MRVILARTQQIQRSLGQFAEKLQLSNFLSLPDVDLWQSLNFSTFLASDRRGENRIQRPETSFSVAAGEDVLAHRPPLENPRMHQRRTLQPRSYDELHLSAPNDTKTDEPCSGGGPAADFPSTTRLGPLNLAIFRYHESNITLLAGKFASSKIVFHVSSCLCANHSAAFWLGADLVQEDSKSFSGERALTAKWTPRHHLCTKKLSQAIQERSAPTASRAMFRTAEQRQRAYRPFQLFLDIHRCGFWRAEMPRRER